MLYVSINSRPDIAASVSILSRKIESPNNTDWTEVKRIFRYLKGAKDVRLLLKYDDYPENILTGYADSDWAGDTLDRKSNTGYLFKINGSLISWASKKQNCVSLSSTEAEYVALAETCQEAIWLKQLLKDFRCEVNNMIINEDNQGCIKLLNQDKINSKTKHIDIKYHFIKHHKEINGIKVEYCPTEHMLADILTKPTEKIKLRNLSNKIGLVGLKSYLFNQ